MDIRASRGRARSYRGVPAQGAGGVAPDDHKAARQERGPAEPARGHRCLGARRPALQRDPSRGVVDGATARIRLSESAPVHGHRRIRHLAAASSLRPSRLEGGDRYLPDPSIWRTLARRNTRTDESVGNRACRWQGPLKRRLHRDVRPRAQVAIPEDGVRQ